MDKLQNFEEKVKLKSIASCVVAGCQTKRKDKVWNVTLFSFPKDSVLNKIWCDNLGVTNHWIQAKYGTLRVCSLHFPSDSLLWAGNRYILNSKHAAPNKINENFKQEISYLEYANEMQPSTSKQQFNEMIIQEKGTEEHDEIAGSLSEFKAEYVDFLKSYDDNRPNTPLGFIEDVQPDRDSERPSTSLGFCSSNLYSASSDEVIPIKKYLKLEKRIKEKDNLIHNLKRQLKRKKDKITTLNDIVENLHNERLLNEETESIIKHSAKGVPVALFKRYASNESLDKITKAKYSKEIETFADTLHFHCPKAYNYVREVFKCALPHPDTIRRRCSKVDGTPELTD